MVHIMDVRLPIRKVILPKRKLLERNSFKYQTYLHEGSRVTIK